MYLNYLKEVAPKAFKRLCENSKLQKPKYF